MLWRRLSGVFLMITGAAATAGMIIIAFAILARYLKLPDAADRLGDASSLAIPVMLASGAVLLLGRWLYGGWSESAPVLNAVAFGIRTAGTFVAMALGGILMIMLATGIEPEDVTIAMVLGAGAITGLGLIALGMRIRRDSERSYLD